MGRILVVGCGFAGAAYGRCLAEAGWTVDFIDRRSHIGGNAFDEVLTNGIRIHRYGPHLFHTNSKFVVDWLTKFGEFVPYEHRVQALLPNGQLVPLPINRLTINTVFSLKLVDDTQVQAFLRTQARNFQSPTNAYEHLAATLGDTLTNLFFRPYTKKMWGLDLEEIDASVVKRIPLRFDEEDRYFPTDRYQLMPRDGFTKVFENILDHDKIYVRLNQEFDHKMLKEYEFCFNSMSIDEYFQYEFGFLPYRSIRFHHENVSIDTYRGSAATINYTVDGPLTRETDWARLPHHVVKRGDFKTITKEEPCDYVENNFERYYPVRTSDGRHQVTYQKYLQMAHRERNVIFIGRCGTYQYLDMHQVINQSLMGAQTWIKENQISE